MITLGKFLNNLILFRKIEVANLNRILGRWDRIHTPTSLQYCAQYLIYLVKEEEIQNIKSYDVEPFDITQLLPCPPYCPPVINLPGPGLPLFPDKGKY
jgi:hypothetical protein